MQFKVPLKFLINITAFLAVLLFISGRVKAQTDTLSNNKGTIAVVATVGAYAVTTAFLYSAWYSDYPQTNFHFFNDKGEWLYMDKIGHMSSAYYLSRWNSLVLKSAGVDSKKAAVAGTLTAWGFLLGIEVMDGFSAGWGFSVHDVAFNTIGAAAFYAQDRIWGDQRITFKFSVQATDYAQYRPDLLGSTPAERILKDYNGQTYWISVNPRSFSKGNSFFPAWLNIAAGYGAEGMLGAKSNPPEYNGEVLPQFDRYTQFYLAPDIDLTRIKTKSRVIKTLCEVFGFLKIPAPTMEITGKGNVKFHALYF